MFTVNVYTTEVEATSEGFRAAVFVFLPSAP